VESCGDLIIPAQRIAQLCGGELRNGRALVHCPVHSDRTPSLSIKDGKDHRALVYCFAQCTLSSILAELGLSRGDLFVSRTPLSREELRTVEAQRRKAEQERQQRRHGHRLAVYSAREVRLHERLVERLGETLARTSDDDPRLDLRVKTFHQAVNQLHVIEMALAVIDVTVFGKAL
jgi:hypothetical protein